MPGSAMITEDGLAGSQGSTGPAADLPTGTARASRRPDASMDLLNQILAHPLDPDYAEVAARGAPPSKGHWMLGLTLLLAAGMFALAAVQTTRSAPQVEQERKDLITRIQSAEKSQDQLEARIDQTSAQIRTLRSSALGGGSQASRLTDQINELDPQVGQDPVVGPGLVITVDDAPQTSANGTVLDVDLQQLVNGLWQAGAEAVAINGHRVTALTAIRSAGDAITVNYRSLTGPYVVTAIGDPATLPAKFADSAGGVWWNGLHQNYGMRFDIAAESKVQVAGDAGLSLRWAKEKK